LKNATIIGKSRVIFSCYLQEIKNEMISNPKITLLWIPRGLLDIAIVFLTYHWLIGNLRLGIIVIIAAALIAPFLIAGLQSYSRLYRDKRMALLLTTPTPFRQIMMEKWLEIIGPSMEIIFLLGMPLLLAVNGLPAITVFIIFSALILGVLLSSLLGITATLLTARYTASWRSLIIIGFIILVFVFSSLSLSKLNYSEIIRSGFMDKIYLIVLAQLWFIATFFSFLVMAGRRIEKVYFLGRSQILEAKLSSKNERRKRLELDIFKYMSGAVSGIIAKETLLYWRNPMQWFRFFLTLSLFTLYPFVKGRLISTTDTLLILAFNISFTIILVHIFINEVVINAFISETSRLSLMLTAPVSAWKIMISKFMANLFLPLFLSMIGMTAVAVWSGMGLPYLILSLILVFFINFGVVGVLVGLGASNTALGKEISTYLDQFMVEQVFITNTKSVFILLAGSLVVLINLGYLYLPYISRDSGFVANPLIIILYGTIFIVFNVIVALVSLTMGNIWLKLT